MDDTHEDANGKPVPPYLVMECVVGQSLQEKLDRVGTLRLAEILRISRQIGEGLATAHKQGLIHRDIKPANILLENYLHYAAVRRLGMYSILLTLGGFLYAFFSPLHSSPQGALELVERIVGYTAAMIFGWVTLMLIAWNRRQMSMRSVRLLTSSSFASAAFGYLWGMIVQLPTVSDPTTLCMSYAVATLPTVIWLLFCGYVLREMARSAEFRQQFASPVDHSGMRKWFLLIVIMCVVCILLFTRLRKQDITPSSDEIKQAIEYVAQRFHKPVSSVASIVNGEAVVALKSEGHTDELMHLKKSPTGRWELDPAYHATTIEIGKGDSLGPMNDEWGGLIVTKPDPGLCVALIGSGPRIIGFTPPLLPEGRHKIPVGSCLPHVFDTQAGWLGDLKSNPQGKYNKIYHTIDTTIVRSGHRRKFLRRRIRYLDRRPVCG